MTIQTKNIFEEVVSMIESKIASYELHKNAGTVAYIMYIPILSNSSSSPSAFKDLRTLDIRELVEKNFGAEVLVGHAERLMDIELESFIIADPTPTPVFGLRLITRVGIVATKPVVFYATNPKAENAQLYELDSYEFTDWGKGTITINKSGVNLDRQKYNAKYLTDYTRRPLVFKTGSQYRVTKEYSGNRTPEGKSIMYKLSSAYSGPFIPEALRPLTAKSTVYYAYEYTNKCRRTWWECLNSVPPFKKGIVWKLNATDFDTYSGYSGRHLIGDAAKAAEQVFDQFPY